MPHSLSTPRCHEGYNLDKFPETTKVFPSHVRDGLTFGHLNTQAAEQCNAALELICSQLAYMSQPNFLQYSKYFLYRFNQRKQEKMAPV